ncbi:MAG: Flp pilus assembly protein CpaB [bacterium]|nr:Flp pilus assembly protein CpaB [bacterium]
MGVRFVIIGIILGLITCWLAFFYFKTVEKKPAIVKEEIRAPKSQKTSVVFAVGEIPPQTVIDSSMVTLKELEPETVSREAITSLSGVVGSIAKVNISPNTPILSSQIYFGVGRLAYIVPPERRAITILIDNPGAVSYLVTPGDIVDVIGTFETDFAGRLITKTIVQDAIVLATGQQYLPKKTADEVAKPPVSFDTVTLAVYPRDAERLALGSDKASKLRLSLRHPASNEWVWTGGATPPDVLGLPKEKPKETVFVKTGTATIPEVKTEVIKHIEVYKGTKKETVVLEWR